MRYVRSTAFAALALAAAFAGAGEAAPATAADGTAATSVPDPHGLGERLALIVWLRENRYDVRLNATLDELRGQYRRAQQGNEPWESVAERDRLRRWRQALVSQHRVDIPEGVTAAQLRRIQDHLEAQVQREVDALLAKEAATPRSEPAAAAPEPAVAARPNYGYAPAVPAQPVAQAPNVTIYNAPPPAAPVYRDHYGYYPGASYTTSHIGFSPYSYYSYPTYYPVYSYPRSYHSHYGHCHYPRYFYPGRVSVVRGVPVSGIGVRARGIR